jgi:hypothetical protein
MTRQPRLKAAVRPLTLAVCAGAVLGIAARLAMRVVAWQSDVSASFSFGGSLEIVVLGVMIGAPVALLYWVCRARLGLPRWTGVGFALLLFAILALRPTPSARSALAATPDRPRATLVTFAAVFIVYGVALDLLWRPRRSS